VVFDFDKSSTVDETNCRRRLKTFWREMLFVEGCATGTGPGARAISPLLKQAGAFCILLAVYAIIFFFFSIFCAALRKQKKTSSFW
jgi:hypothetical protein